MSRRRQAWRLLTRLLLRQTGSTTSEKAWRAPKYPQAFWIELISLANANLVTAATWRAIEDEAMTDHVPDDAQDYLSSFYEINADRNRSIVAQFLECAKQLNQVGIEPMPIKGCAYLLSGYVDDPAERFLSDLDLLVPEHQARLAADSLRAFGYRRANWDFDYTAHHHLPPMIMPRRPTAIEIHVAAAPLPILAAIPTEAIWNGAETVERDGASFSIPNPTDLLTVSMLHAIAVDRFPAKLQLPLRFLRDAMLLLSRTAHAPDAALVIDRITSIGEAQGLSRYANALRRLSGRNYLPSVRHGFYDQVHFALSELAVSHPASHAWIRRARTLLTPPTADGNSPASRRDALLYRVRTVGQMASRFKASLGRRA